MRRLRKMDGDASKKQRRAIFVFLSKEKTFKFNNYTPLIIKSLRDDNATYMNVRNGYSV
jgi:hypothetical protein